MPGMDDDRARRAVHPGAAGGLQPHGEHALHGPDERGARQRSRHRPARGFYELRPQAIREQVQLLRQAGHRHRNPRDMRGPTMKTTEDYAEEFEELMEAADAGKTDGDGPEDVAPIEEVQHG